MSLGYRAFIFLSLGLFATSALEAQPRIEHENASCLPRERFTRFFATIRPPEEIGEARLYFRSHLYSEFYFVDFARGETSGAFQAVLPLPNAETTRVIYYIEAVDVSFQTSRSEDFELPVSGESSCRPAPGAFFPGGDPGIVVGSTRAGMPALPSGFQASGISGFIPASGGAAGAGGGIGAGVTIGAAAGAAAGVGLLVAGGEGGNGETTDAPGALSEPPSTTTSAASSTTTTSSSAGPPTPPSTTTSSSAGPTPPSTTTTSTGSPAPPNTTTTTAPVTLTACFQWRALGNCQVFFDSCSTPVSAIRIYEWRMLGPPVPDPPAAKSFTFSFDADPRCREPHDFNRPVRLTVYDELGRSASIQENVSVRPGAGLKSQDAETVGLRFTSHLVATAAYANVRGQLRVNGAPLPPSGNTAPQAHDVRVRKGRVEIEATTLGRAPEATLWELDFTASEAVVPGSLSVPMGTIVSLDGLRIVLRLNGEDGERVLLRLETK